MSRICFYSVRKHALEHTIVKLLRGVRKPKSIRFFPRNSEFVNETLMLIRGEEPMSSRTRTAFKFGKERLWPWLGLYSAALGASALQSVRLDWP